MPLNLQINPPITGLPLMSKGEFFFDGKGGFFPPGIIIPIFLPPFLGTRDSCQMHDLWRQLPHKVFMYLYVYDENVVLKDLKFQAEDKGNFPFPTCYSGSCLGRV